MGSQHRVRAVSWIIHHGEVPGQLGEEVDGAGLAEQLLPRLETDQCQWESSNSMLTNEKAAGYLTG